MRLHFNFTRFSPPYANFRLGWGICQCGGDKKSPVYGGHEVTPVGSFLGLIKIGRIEQVSQSVLDPSSLSFARLIRDRQIIRSLIHILHNYYSSFK